MSSYRSFLIGIGMLTSVSTISISANANNACIALLKHGIYNTNSSSSTQQTFAQYKSTFCTWYGSYRNSHSGGNASLQIPVVDIPVGLSGSMSYGQAESQYQALCSNNEGLNSDNNVFTNMIQYLSPEGAAAFTDCLKAEKAGVSSNVTISDDQRLFTIDMAYLAPIGASPAATITQVSMLPQDAFECPKPDHGATDIRDLVGKPEKFINQNFSLSCVRKIFDPPVSINGSKFAAPAAMLSIQTNVGSYTQHFRPILVSDPLADTVKVLNALPKGTIFPWAGKISEIPSGWHLCDGTNGTPNLVHRYPLGTSTDSEIATPTGSDTIQLHVSGDTTATTNKDFQNIDNSTNYLQATGTGHIHHFDAKTDPAPLWPASTYIVYIMKIQNQVAAIH
ncbi:MAG TPA: hypothetical protein VJ770_28770 [Stellaceae bacterium]|nr:hypothetical protein [Stellaceae bacterium]